MQTLFDALLQRKHTVEASNGKTRVTVLGEQMNIHLRERHVRQLRQLTTAELRSQLPYDVKPSGELELHIDTWPARVVKDTAK